MILTEHADSLYSKSSVCFLIFSHSTFDVGRSTCPQCHDSGVSSIQPIDLYTNVSKTKCTMPGRRVFDVHQFLSRLDWTLAARGVARMRLRTSMSPFRWNLPLRCRTWLEQRTAEYRMSKDEWWNRYAKSFLKQTEFIHSTFDVGRSTCPQCLDSGMSSI